LTNSWLALIWVALRALALPVKQQSHPAHFQPGRCTAETELLQRKLLPSLLD
jgi:hypothetical protein